MKPKRCARLFGKQLNCDADFNEKLSRLEWANCLTKERFIGELKHMLHPEVEIQAAAAVIQ